MDTYKQKVAHLQLIYHLACADTIITKAELVYIRNVAERLGVDLAELEKFNSAEPELELPDKEYKLYSLFHRLVIIIMVDNEVTETEKRYCFNLGVKMGLHPNAIGEIMEYIITNGPMYSLPQEITAIFRKYMS